MNSLEQPSSALKATSTRFLVLGLVAMASSSAYLTRQCLGVANTTIAEELSLTTEQMGWIGSAYAFGYLVFQVPGGWLGNKFGTRAALAGISVFWSLFTFWTAAAQGFFGLFASRVNFGLAQAGLVPISSKVVKDWFPVTRRGAASSTITASMSLGSVVAMFLTALLLKYLHWRTIFALYSMVGILWSILYFWFFRTDPAEHSWVNKAELDLIRKDEVVTSDDLPAEKDPAAFAENQPQSEDQPSSEFAKSESDERNPYAASQMNPSSASSSEESAAELTTPPLAVVILSMATSLSLWGVCLQVFFRAAGYTVFMFWLPAILEKGYGANTVKAGFLSGFPPMGVVVGSLIGGQMIDTLLHLTGSKYVSRCFSSASCLILASLITLLALLGTTPEWVVAALTAGIVVWSIANPATWVATMDIAGKDTAIVMGVMNMAGTLGGITLPIAFGYLIGDIEKTGGNWNIVIYIIALIHFLPGLCWLVVNPNRLCTRPRH